MTGPTHLSFGILAATIQYKLTGSISLDGIIIGALLPDIDDKRSVIGKCCSIASTPISWMQKPIRAFEHRKIFHSLLLPATLYFFAVQYESLLLYGIIIGILSHLFADMLNDRGVNLFYPIRISFRLASITTGKRWEGRVNIMVWLVIVWLVTPREWIVQTLDFVRMVIT